MNGNEQPDWNTADPEVKKKAVYDFCTRLDKDVDGIRDSCRDKPRTARDTLQEAGNFKNMPEDLPIYVCEDNAQDRGKVMAIILPKKGELPKWEDFDIKSTCPCTWTPYVEFLSESLLPGDTLTIQIRKGR
jgi:hypothetical protein